MERNDTTGYLVSDSGVFYRHQGNQWFGHSGNGQEHPVADGNDGLDKVKSGECSPISKEEYEKGIDPHIVR